MLIVYCLYIIQQNSCNWISFLLKRSLMEELFTSIQRTRVGSPVSSPPLTDSCSFGQIDAIHMKSCRQRKQGEHVYTWWKQIQTKLQRNTTHISSTEFYIGILKQHFYPAEMTTDSYKVLGSTGSYKTMLTIKVTRTLHTITNSLIPLQYFKRFYDNNLS